MGAQLDHFQPPSSIAALTLSRVNGNVAQTRPRRVGERVRQRGITVGITVTLYSTP